MSQEVPTDDIIFGAIILVIFLIIALFIGRLLSSFKNRRFTQAWAPLVPLINGTIRHDGGGAATSWLTGTYHGKQVQASMIPGRNRYQEEADRYNYFDAALLGLAGGQDWQIEYKTGVLGLGETGWHIAADDETLRARLENPAILSTLTHLGRPTIEYSARGRTLRYSEDVTPRWVPTAERFQEELELLLLLAAIHEETNPA